MRPLAMVFDLTSSSAKCAVASLQGELLATRQARPKVETSGDSFQRQHEPRAFLKLVMDLARETIAAANAPPGSVEYITCASIRPSCVFLDEDSRPVYLGASFDLRGMETSDALDEALQESTGKTFFEVTGHFPSLMFAPARYAWFKEREQDQGRRIAYYMPVDSWILCEFGGEDHANLGSAAESGFFNIKEKYWEDAWEDVLDLPPGFLPPAITAGEIVGDVSDEIKTELKLARNAVLVSGMPDSQAALVGSASLRAGDACVIVGSTTPVQAVLDGWLLDDNEKAWTTLVSLKHVIDAHILETNSGTTGSILEWLGTLLFSNDGVFKTGMLEKLDADYEVLDRLENSGYVNETLAFLGPAPLAAASNELLPGVLVTPSPGAVDAEPGRRCNLVGAVFENIAFAAASNLEYLEALLGKQLNPSLLGGITRSGTFCQRFSDLVGTGVKVSVEAEATIIGLVYTCAVAAGEVNSPGDIENLAWERHLRTLEPRESRVNLMRERLEHWKSFQARIRGL